MLPPAKLLDWADSLARDPTRWLALALSAHLGTGFLATASGVIGTGLAIAATALLVVFSVKLAHRPVFWVMALAVLFVSGFTKWQVLANHTWLLAYASLGLALGQSLPQVTDLQRAQRWLGRGLLVAIMSFAILHRLFSPEYLSGSFFGFSMATGSFGKFLFETGWFPEALDAFARNREWATLVADQWLTDGLVPYVTLQEPFPHFQTIATVMAWVVLVYEFWVAFILAWKPSSRLAHASLGAFVLGLVLIRPETIFLAVVASLGMMVTRPEQKNLRRSYAALVALNLALVPLTDEAKHVVIPEAPPAREAATGE